MSREIPDDPIVVQPIFDTLKRNFLTGKTKPLQARKAALKCLIDGYKALKEEFELALEKDLGTGKYFSELIVHGVTIDDMEDLHDNLESWAKPESVPTPLVTGMGGCSIEYEPLGVALVISAWNYPVYTAIPQVAAAIAAGNCVILKPSELASHSSGVIKKLFDNYMNPDFYQCIEGRIEVAKTVTKLPVDVICFTGSTATGRLVAIEAAKNLVPCILELGGKCPVIIDQTATLDAAINRLLSGKFINCGQTCIGADHLYVHQSRKKQFKEMLMSKLTTSFEGGQNLEEEGNYGKIINKFHIQRLQKLLKDNHGGNILYGGTIKKQSRYISPTVIEEPKKQALLMQQQIFGPILPVFYYSNLQELVNQIVTRAKPLVVYHFTQSKKNVELVKGSTSSGAYVTNDCIMQIANKYLPFGGVGGSGYGRMHGVYGFKAFSNPKSVALLSSLDTYPSNKRYMPWTDDKKNLMRKVLKVAFYTPGQIGKVLGLIILVIVGAILCGVLIPRQ